MAHQRLVQYRSHDCVIQMDQILKLKIHHFGFSVACLFLVSPILQLFTFAVNLVSEQIGALLLHQVKTWKHHQSVSIHIRRGPMMEVNKICAVNMRMNEVV